MGEGCFGVIQSDGACDITGGDVICAFNNTITSPTTVSGIPAFGGTVSSSHDVGNYSFNSNNTGSLTLTSYSERQDPVIRRSGRIGQRVNVGRQHLLRKQLRGSSDPDDPEARPDHQRVAVRAASSVTFDPAGGSAGGNGLGRGFDAIAVANEQHLDPETGTTLEGGGTIFFNVDGGYDSDIAPGVKLLPSSLIVDFHTTVLQDNTGAGQDGTELTSAALNGDYSDPLSGAAFQTAAVLYGATNSSAYVATTGSAGAPAHGLAIANSTKAIMAGSDTGAGVILVASASNPHPSKTITITNGSTEPLDWTAIQINGVADVTNTGTGTCPSAGDLPAWNPVATGATKPTCTITFQDSGTTCTSGSPETGTWELVGADHTMITGTPNGTGVTFSLKCE